MRIIKSKLSLILFLIALIFVVACTSRSADLDLGSRVGEIEAGKSFRLDTINTVDWDSVHILAPNHYGVTTSSFPILLEAEEYELPEEISADLSSISADETYSLLIFFRDQKFVNYCLVPIQLVSFNWPSFAILVYPSTQVYKMDGIRTVSVVD